MTIHEPELKDKQAIGDKICLLTKSKLLYQPFISQ